MRLSEGGKSFQIGLVVLIQYRRVTDSHPASQPTSHPPSQTRYRSYYRAYYVAQVKKNARSCTSYSYKTANIEMFINYMYENMR